MQDAINRAKELIKSDEAFVSISASDLNLLVNAAEVLEFQDLSHRQTQLIKSCLKDLEEAKQFDAKGVENFDSRTFSIIQKDGSITKKARHNWRIGMAMRTLKRVIDGKLSKGAKGVRSKDDDV